MVVTFQSFDSDKKPLIGNMKVALLVLLVGVLSQNVPVTGQYQSPIQDTYTYMPPVSTCQRLIDVVLVVDGSETISQSEFEKIRTALTRATQIIQVGTDSKMGVVLYSTGLDDVIALTGDAAALTNFIGNMVRPKGETQTHLGINEMTRIFGKYGRHGVPKVGIVITDGESKYTQLTLNAAKEATNKSINIFAIGVGNDVNTAELKGIASKLSQVSELNDFDTLASTLSSLILQVCPIDGGWGPWSNYGTCSLTCGSGTQARNRTCDSPAPANGGAPCQGSSSQSRACNTSPCPVDGGWGGWSNYGTCSLTCGSGTQVRYRSCDSPAPANGGTNCPGPSSQSQACNTSPCPAPTTTTTQPPPPATGPCAGCEIRNGIGYNPHQECDKFIQCQIGANKEIISYTVETCPVGTFWSQDKLTCDHIYNVDCPNDRCKDRTVKTYKTGGACYDYYICVNGASRTARCPNGRAYPVNSKNGRCIASPACTAPNPAPAPVPKDCFFRERVNDPCYYDWVVGSRVYHKRPCAFGTNFNQKECLCDKTNVQSCTAPAPVCKPIVDIDFDGPEPGEYDNYGAVIENGHAEFDGKSNIKILALANVDFRSRVNIKVAYKSSDYSDVTPQAVVTNGDCGIEAPIAILAEGNRTRLNLENVNGVKDTVTKMTYGAVKTIEFDYKAGTFSGKVNTETFSRSFGGLIKRSQCAFQLGHGQGFQDFKGYIDYIIVSTCD